MAPKKPAGLALIVGGPAKSEDAEPALDAAKVGERAAARSLLSAFKADDVEGVQSALRNYLTACGALDGAAEEATEGEGAEY